MKTKALNKTQEIPVSFIRDFHLNLQNQMQETDNGTFELSNEHKQLTEEFVKSYELLHEVKTGIPQIQALFAKIISNMALKVSAQDILFQKSFQLILTRMDECPGMISNKDLIALLKIASQESSTPSKELKELFNAYTGIKDFESEQRLKQLRREHHGNYISDERKEELVSVMTDIKTQIEKTAREKQTDKRKKSFHSEIIIESKNEESK
jgi:hypothetical protein